MLCEMQFHDPDEPGAMRTLAEGERVEPCPASSMGAEDATAWHRFESRSKKGDPGARPVAFSWLGRPRFGLAGVHVAFDAATTQPRVKTVGRVS